MGVIKQSELENDGDRLSRLDRKFIDENPDLAMEGWEREDWEALEHALQKDD